jgi:hypothetical protein
MKEWIIVLAALLGALAGGLISLLVQSSRIKHEIRFEAARRMLDRLEEAHKILSVIENNFLSTSAHINFRKYFGHSLDAEGLNEKAEIKKLSMIVAIYTPSAKTEFEKLKSAMDRFTESVGKGVVDKTLGTNKDDGLHHSIRKQASDVAMLCRVVQRRLEEIAGEYIQANPN